MLNRKRPEVNLAVDHTKGALDDLTTEIDTYIEKSPISNKFRVENPNLHPVDDNDSSFLHQDDVRNTYSRPSLEERWTRQASPQDLLFDPSSRHKSSHMHKQSFYNTELMAPSERLPSPSLDFRALEVENVLKVENLPPSPDLSEPKVENFPPPPQKPYVPLTRTISRTASLKQKMKRFSLSSLNSSSSSRSSNPNRLSISGSFNRLSLSNRTSTSSLQGSHQMYRANGTNISTTSVNSTTSINSTPSVNSHNSTATIEPESPSTPFWKYHILKFGKDLYLTTNPGLKHVYCRNGPGYYVEIIHTDKQHKSSKAKHGFTLIFKDIASMDPSNTNNPPIMVITKKLEKEGGYFSISIPGLTSMKANTRNPQSGTFNGLMIPKKINPLYIPKDHISTKLSIVFQNYEVKDMKNVRWNIGSIPRVRTSKFNLIKHRLKNSASNSHRGAGQDSLDLSNNENTLKYIGKRNVYFHQNYIEEEWNHRLNLKYKELSSDPSKIYLQDSLNEFPPVLAFFRPYETNTRKRIMNTINTKNVLERKQPLPHTRNQLLRKSSMSNDQFKGKNLDHDIGVGSDVHKYYKGDDGLNSNPKDDTPNDNKLGWITIYEDQALFSGSSNKGMFETVLGLTLAAGFESSLE